MDCFLACLSTNVQFLMICNLHFLLSIFSKYDHAIPTRQQGQEAYQDSYRVPRSHESNTVSDPDCLVSLEMGPVVSTLMYAVNTQEWLPLLNRA